MLSTATCLAIILGSGAAPTDKYFRISVVDQQTGRGVPLVELRTVHNTRYFTDSGIMGSKNFVRRNFQRFKGLFQTENDRVPKKVSGLEGIYSMKRLT